MAKTTFVYAGMKTLDTSDPTLIPRDHFADTQNMIRREDGLWENRKGIQQFGEDVGSDSPVHSMHFWKLEDGTRYLTVGSDDDIHSYAEGSSYNDGTFTSRQALTSSNKWDATVYRDTIVIGNGIDDIYTSTDNSTFTARNGANIANPRFLDQGNDFVSFAGDPSATNTFYLSGGAPANPWEYDSNNTLNIDIGNGENVTGTVSLGANIIVTKTNRTYLVDLASLSRSTIDWAGGTESDRALLQTQLNEVLVAGRQGIYSVGKTQIGSNQYFGNPESELIKSLYDTCTDYAAINSLYIPDENYALFAMNTSTKGNIVFVKNLDFGDPVWTYFTGVNALDWAVYQDSDANNHYLYGDANQDKVMEILKGRDDDGNPILSKLLFKNDDFGNPGLIKHVSHIDISGYISSLAEWQFEIYSDDEITPFKTGVITKNELTNDKPSLLGLGAGQLGRESLGGVLGSSTGDTEVKAFNVRINIDKDVEKLQVLLYNNQRDVRVVFRAMVIYAEVRPKDHFANRNII